MAAVWLATPDGPAPESVAGLGPAGPGPRGGSSASRLASLKLTATTLEHPGCSMVTPYSWSYDQLLLVIPIMTTALALVDRGKGFLFAALLFPGMALLSLIVLIPDDALGIEILNVFIPLVVFLLLAFILPGKKSETKPQI